jgi:hypothetical protein
MALEESSGNEDDLKADDSSFGIARFEKTTNSVPSLDSKGKRTEGGQQVTVCSRMRPCEGLFENAVQNIVTRQD